MPVNNAAPFLEDCLSSILTQSENNWELIAVNDGSTDESRSILDQFASRDSRISVFDNDGKGIIDALRFAYAKSKGQFITRMDADDRMAPKKLEILKQNLVQSGTTHLSTGLVKYFSDGELKDGYRYYESWLNGLTASGTNYHDIYRECVIPSPCWMVHRSDLDACGAFNSERYPEDYDLCFRFYKAGLKPIACSEVLHHWRDHPARSSRNDPNYADNRFLSLKLHWFLEIDRDVNRPLVLWGAGGKGKALAKALVEQDIPFRWMCNNPNKIGKTVYGMLMENVKNIDQLNAPQVIVVVANKPEQAEIAAQMKGQAVFFFC